MSLSQNQTWHLEDDWYAGAGAPSLEDNILSSIDAQSTLKQMLLNHPEWSKHVEHLPPPSQVYDRLILVVAGIYFLLFLIGVCGNSSVIAMIVHITMTLKQSISRENSFLYIILLCCVDFMVLLSLPITISDLLLGHWMFGTWICRIYWIFESAGKVLSSFLLTALSFDRYAAVCCPLKRQLRSRKSWLFFVSFLVLLSFVLLIPLPYYAETKNRVSDPFILKETQIVRFSVTKCFTTNMPKSVLLGFTSYVFLLCYCVPMLLMTFFYCRMLYRLREHSITVKQTRIPLRKITLYSMAVVCFYSACWGPYWAINLAIIVSDESLKFSDTVIFLMYCIHGLPFVNSAFNWVFYALLNSRLQESRREMIDLLNSTRTRASSYSKGEYLRDRTSSESQYKMKKSSRVSFGGHMLIRRKSQSSPTLQRLLEECQIHQRREENEGSDDHPERSPQHQQVISEYSCGDFNIRLIQETDSVSL